MAGAVSPLRRLQCRIAGVVAVYTATSISLVFTNKVLLESIHAPLFVTACQCLVTVLLCVGLAAVRSDIPGVEYDWRTAMRVMPLSLVFVGMIALNNVCLQYVPVSFYNVARSFTIVFNTINSFVLLGESTSRFTLCTLGIVVLGFVIGVDGEVSLPLLGTLFGVCSSMFVSLNSVFTKSTLSAVGGNKFRLMLYNNLNACVLFVPLLGVTGEAAYLWSPAGWATVASPLPLFKVCCSALLSFVMGFITVAQIELTSPLTHSIVGTAKACLQTGLAFAVWRNPTTVQHLFGNALVLAGTLLYSWVRNSELTAGMAKTSVEDSSKAT